MDYRSLNLSKGLLVFSEGMLLGKRSGQLLSATMFLTLSSFIWGAELPVVVGEPGNRLPRYDLRAVGRLVGAPGGQPWLLARVRGMAGMSEIVSVYASPAVSTESVRRGTLWHVHRQLTERGGSWRPWRLGDNEPYAQVRIPGRDFGDVRGPGDFNRPFSVNGEFSNEELVAIVNYLRTSPTIEDSLEPRGRQAKVPRVRGGSPIWWMKRHGPGSVEVNLVDGASRGQLVRLKQVGKRWIVLVIQEWIA